jgi:phage tail-like protein
MARSTSFDAYEKFRFSISWSDSTNDAAGSAEAPLVRAGFHDIDQPQRNTTIGEYREGQDADFVQKFSGLHRFANIAMHRGMTSATDFYNWAKDVHNPEIHKGQVAIATNPSGSLAAGQLNIRKDLTVILSDRTGTPVRAWRLLNCLVVDFKDGDKMDASEDGSKLMEELTVTPEDVYELKVVAGVISEP